LRLLSIERQLLQILRYEEYALERQSVVYRPTEMLAMQHLDYGIPHAWSYQVVRQPPPVVIRRNCIDCKQALPLDCFEAVTNNHTGYSWACTACRGKRKRRTWRDVPQTGKWGNWKAA
jgi:hypothetical protein